MTVSDGNRIGMGWRLWLQSVLASIAGMLAAVFLVDSVLRPALGPAIDRAGNGDWGSNFLALAVATTTIGAVIGLMQWLVLQRQIAGAGWWILASASGFFASVVVFEALHVPLSDQMLRVIGGVAIGIVQWLVLRRQVPGAFWWVPATTLGIVAADLIARLAGKGEVVVWAAALGAVTGGALLWLLRRTARQVPATA